MKYNITEVENLHISVQSDDEIEKMVNLWRTVVTHALDDLKLKPTNKRYKKWRKQAREWFLYPGEDFYVVCEMAMLSVEEVLTLAYQIMSKN